MSLTEDILSRVAKAAGCDPRSLGRVLDVSRTTVSSWKSRDTIPIKKLLAFANERRVSLDYLLLGRGGPRPSGSGIDEELFDEVVTALEGEEDTLRGVPLRRLGDRIVLIYNQAAIVQDEEQRRAVIAAAVRMLAREVLSSERAFLDSGAHGFDSGTAEMMAQEIDHKLSRLEEDDRAKDTDDKLGSARDNGED